MHTQSAISAQPQIDTRGKSNKHSPLLQAERELDHVIRDLALRSERAEREGDPTGRDLYVTRRDKAIASRTPAHRARLLEESHSGGFFDVSSSAVRRRTA